MTKLKKQITQKVTDKIPLTVEYRLRVFVCLCHWLATKRTGIKIMSQQVMIINSLLIAVVEICLEIQLFHIDWTLWINQAALCVGG